MATKLTTCIPIFATACLLYQNESKIDINNIYSGKFISPQGCFSMKSCKNEANAYEYTHSKANYGCINMHKYSIQIICRV